MFSGLLIILVPLIVGYLIPLRQKAALRVINQLLSWMVYLILFFIANNAAMQAEAERLRLAKAEEKARKEA